MVCCIVILIRMIFDTYDSSAYHHPKYIYYSMKHDTADTMLLTKIVLGLNMILRTGLLKLLLREILVIVVTVCGLAK